MVGTWLKSWIKVRLEWRGVRFNSLTEVVEKRPVQRPLKLASSSCVQIKNEKKKKKKKMIHDPSHSNRLNPLPHFHPHPSHSSATTLSPRCACSSTPPGLSWEEWPGPAQRWRVLGCGWVDPWGVVQRASSRGSSACGLGWKTRPPACWARSSPYSGPPGRCSLSGLRRAYRVWTEEEDEKQ